MWSQLAKTRMVTVRFGGSVALDIAFRGGSANHTDIDNLAHRVVGAFSGALKRSVPDVSAYRAYRLNGGEPGVRVRVMPQDRLLALGEAIKCGRALVRSERSERLRAARLQ